MVVVLRPSIRRRGVVRDGQIQGERLGYSGGRQGAAPFSNGRRRFPACGGRG